MSGEQTLERLSARGRGLLRPEAIRAVFSTVIAAARAVQKPHRIGSLGPEGTFSHQAALTFYGKQGEYIPLRDIEDVLDQVTRAELNTGIVPPENSCEGPVRDTLDQFVLHHLLIQARFGSPFVITS